jgi:hypothetical protein
MWQTIRDALTFSPRLSESVQGNQKTRRIAFLIVLLAALSRALGNVVISLLNQATLPILLVTSVLGTLTVIVGYYFWTFTIWKIGQWSKFNPPPQRELLNPVGFAYSPQILNVLTLIRSGYREQNIPSLASCTISSDKGNMSATGAI